MLYWFETVVVHTILLIGNKWLLLVQMVKERLNGPDSHEKGWLLDGYPRSSSQAIALKEFGFQPDLFILLEVRFCCCYVPHVLSFSFLVKFLLFRHTENYAFT